MQANMLCNVFIIMTLSCLFNLNMAIAKSFDVKSTEIDVMHPTTKKPLKLQFWYPSDKSTVCKSAQICLSKHTDFKQAVVLSHGAMGSVRSLNWLGQAMAKKGLVTVGVNHYGESWVYGDQNIRPQAVLELWERPKSIKAILNWLSSNHSTDKTFTKITNKAINWDNTTLIGHSSGGSTAIALAGGRYNFKAGLEYCATKQSKQDLSCTYLSEIKGLKPPNSAEDSYYDSRIKRIVALDPAAGPLTRIDSLKEVHTPALIVGIQDNDFLRFESHAAVYAKHITSAKLLVLDQGEGHFVFLDSCNHHYKAQGVSLCVDRAGVDRKVVQEKLLKAILSFIFSSN